MQTSRNVRTIPAIHGSSDHVVFRRGPAGIAIQAEAREDEWASVAVGPFDLDEMRTALDHLAATPEETLGAYERHEKHDAAEQDPRSRVGFAKHFRDRCVDLEHRLNLAVMASEHNSERAEKAEGERDEGRDRADAAESRPLTPDAITDEMVERAAHALHEEMGGMPDEFEVMHLDAARAALTAALTEPPARPEGAEELGELIGTWTASEDIAPAQLPTGSLATLADFLAERGVRVVSEDGAR